MAVRLSALLADRQPFTPPPGRGLVLFSVRGWVDPGARGRVAGLGQLKNPVISSGMEPATFRLGAQCLNQLRYGGVGIINKKFNWKWSIQLFYSTHLCCVGDGRCETKKASSTGPCVCVSAHRVFIGTSFLLQLHQSSRLSLDFSPYCLLGFLCLTLAVLLFSNTNCYRWQIAKDHTFWSLNFVLWVQ
jgi:hypothetical protein